MGLEFGARRTMPTPQSKSAVTTSMSGAVRRWAMACQT
jgi:hypothetical protein